MTADAQVEMPPVGLVPRWLRAEQRLDEIRAAMRRYAAEDYLVPWAWIVEQRELTAYLDEHGPKSPRWERVFVRHSIHYPGQWVIHCRTCDWNDRFFSHHWAIDAAHRHANSGTHLPRAAP